MAHTSKAAMTATEVRFRMNEAIKRMPAPDFSSTIYVLARKMRRMVLRDALQGSREDRLKYCFSRAVAKPIANLACYGTCYGTAVYDPNELSELALRWFLRLEHLAHKGVGQEGQL